MAIAVASVGTGAWASGNPSGSVAVNVPSGLAVGDLLVACIAAFGGASAPVLTKPTGFTDLNSSNNTGTDYYYNTYWKVATSTETGAGTLSWSWNQAGGVNAAGVLLRITGFDNLAASPVQGSVNGQADASTTSTNSGLTPTYVDSLYILGLIGDVEQDVSSYALATSNPTWTSRAYVSAANKALSVGTATRTAITATGNATITLGSNATTANTLIIINPSQDAAPTISAINLAGVMPSTTEQVGITLTPVAIPLAGSALSPRAKILQTIINVAKNSASMSNITKHAASMSSLTKHNVASFLLREQGDELLLENNGRIVLDDGTLWANLVKNG